MTTSSADSTGSCCTRWTDASVFSRDVIDLAILNLSKPELETTIKKAQTAYGEAITTDLSKAIKQLNEQDGLLDRCMKVMNITMPKVLL